MGQRIALISALHEELAEVLALMPDEHKIDHAGREFWQGHLHGHEVVAVCSGMGKVAAAATTATLLARFEIDQVIFTGVAGGLQPGVEVGDIVVSHTVLQHDMDASPLYPRHELPGYGTARLPTDLALSQVLAEAAKDTITWLPKLLDEETLRAFGLHSPSVHRGLLITGDRFVATVAESDALRAELPEALAVDMEGAAVVQVCRDHGVPCAVVRTVSDRADNSAHLDFQHFLGQIARHYSARMIRKALNLL